MIGGPVGRTKPGQKLNGLGESPPLYSSSGATPPAGGNSTGSSKRPAVAGIGPRLGFQYSSVSVGSYRLRRVDFSSPRCPDMTPTHEASLHRTAKPTRAS